MTGNFTLILPVMLAVGIATALSKRLSYGSIYTTKLLRRGIDIERPRPTNVLQLLTVADVMLPDRSGQRAGLPRGGRRWAACPPREEVLTALVGPGNDLGAPQTLFSNETLDQALRQLVLYGRVGLPVLAPDGGHLQGWITRRAVLRALAGSARATTREAEQGVLATEISDSDAAARTSIALRCRYRVTRSTSSL